MDTVLKALNLMVSVFIDRNLMGTGTLALSLMNSTRGMLIKRVYQSNTLKHTVTVVHFHVPNTYWQHVSFQLRYWQNVSAWMLGMRTGYNQRSCNKRYHGRRPDEWSRCQFIKQARTIEILRMEKGKRASEPRPRMNSKNWTNRMTGWSYSGKFEMEAMRSFLADERIWLMNIFRAFSTQSGITVRSITILHSKPTIEISVLYSHSWRTMLWSPFSIMTLPVWCIIDTDKLYIAL